MVMLLHKIQFMRNTTSVSAFITGQSKVLNFVVTTVSVTSRWESERYDRHYWSHLCFFVVDCLKLWQLTINVQVIKGM